MIDWTSIQPALISLVASLSGIEQVIWEGSPVPIVPAGTALGEISIFSLSDIGMLDDRQYVVEDLENPEDGLLHEEVKPLQTATMRIKCTSYEQLPPVRTARQYLEVLRPKLGFYNTAVTLSALGLTVLRTLSLVPLSAAKDARMRSIEALDVRLAIRQTVRDTQGVERIEAVETEAEIPHEEEP